MLLAAAGGAIIGGALGFWIGRAAGYPLALRYGSYVGLTESRLKLGQYLFQHHGGKIVFFGRFIAFVRALAAFLAGANRMPWGRFMLFNVSGAVLWAVLFGVGAFVLGRQIRRLAGPVGIAGIVVVVLVFLAGAWFLRRRHSQMQAQAERALPGKLRPPERVAGN